MISVVHKLKPNQVRGSDDRQNTPMTERIHSHPGD